MWGLLEKMLKTLVITWRCITFSSMMADDAGGGAGGGAAEDQEPWKTNPAYKTRPNTPLTRTTRASPVWGMIKRLNDDHPKTKEGYTHACIHADCGCFLKVQKTKGNWVTTKCVIHVKSAHPTSALGKEYLKTAKDAEVNTRGGTCLQRPLMSKLASRQKPSPRRPLFVRRCFLQDERLSQHARSMFPEATPSAAPASARGSGGGGGGGAAFRLPTSPFILSDRQRAYSAQARWFVYSRQHISFAAFDDEYFKDMMRAVGGAGAAILTKEMLKKYIEAEFAIFLICLNLICTLKMAQSYGTPSVQAIHDGATAANKKKYQVLAIQLVDPRWKCNLVICVGFVATLLSTAPIVAGLFNTILIERTGYTLLSLCGLMVSDRAALAVSVKAGINEAEACDMHDGNKVGEAATGKLTRSRMGECVNPFPAGVALLSKAHSMAVHFSYGSRRDELLVFAKSLESAEIMLKVDHNDTRIAAEHCLLFSVLRMNRPLKMYHLLKPASFKLDAADWVMWAEIEAVLNVSQILTKLAQKEKAFTAAYGLLIKMHVLNRLEADALHVIDLDQDNIGPRPVRVVKRVSDFSDTGKECLIRARIEFQRRFLGSTSDTLLPACGPVVINDRQLVATLLDLRTARGGHLTQAQRTQAQAALKTRYIAFFKHFKRQEREKSDPPPEEEEQEEEGGSDDEVKVAAKKVKRDEVAAGELVSGMVYASAGAAEGFDLSLDSSDFDSEPVKSEEDFAREDAAAAEKEFKRVFPNWFGLVVDWKEEFPEANLEGVDLLHDLIDIDLGRLYHKIITKVDPDRSRFGFLPLMAGCCDGQIGALNAESFAERVISGSNLVMTNGNTLLGDKMLEMLVVLRMNREFMEFMRREYAEEIAKTQPFKMTVIAEEE